MTFATCAGRARHTVLAVLAIFATVFAGCSDISTEVEDDPNNHMSGAVQASATVEADHALRIVGEDSRRRTTVIRLVGLDLNEPMNTGERYFLLTHTTLHDQGFGQFIEPRNGGGNLIFSTANLGGLGSVTLTMVTPERVAGRYAFTAVSSLATPSGTPDNRRVTGTFDLQVRR